METTATAAKAVLSKAKQSLLAQRLQGAREPAAARTIPRRKTADAPLAFAQDQLWFLERLEPNSSLYTMAIAFRVYGELDLLALAQALTAILARHEILRTRFIAVNDEPRQVVEPPRPFELKTVELTDATTAIWQTAVATEAARPFNLESDLMLRATVFRLAPQDCVLLFGMHHIASDGWSWAIFLRELSALYAAAKDGKEEVLSSLAIQYGDYASWEREQFQAGKWSEQFSCWRQHLAGAPMALELPSDFKRPTAQSFRGSRENLMLDAELTEQLNQLARREGVTLYLLLLAAFKVLLHRYTQHEDLVIGSPVAGRNQIETEGLIGFFVKTLVLRTDLSGRPGFRDLLQRVKQVVLNAHANQDVPFERLVEELRPTRNPGMPPLVQVMFAFQNTPAREFHLPGVTATPIELPTQTAKFDLTLFAEEARGQLRLSAEYNTDLFTAATVSRGLRHLKVLLTGIVANPEQSIARLPLLEEWEQKLLCDTWKGNEVEFPRDCNIAQLFETQVERTPEAIAVAYGESQLTYRELNVRANQLARHLQTLGVGPDQFVAVVMERSVELIVALVATVKAGGAYVALDPTHPQERLAAMLKDCRPRVLLTVKKWQSSLKVTESVPLICLDNLPVAVTEASETNVSGAATATDLAYVSFTSGSTGGPKGVCVPHRAVVRLVRNTDYLQLSEGDVVAQVSNCAFDASTFEIWGALLNGAQLQVFPQSLVLAPELFRQELEQRKVTALFVTTALFNQFTQDDPQIFSSVRNVLFGGDVVNVRRVAEVLRHGRPHRLLHVYGPTECTTFATWYEVRELSDTETTVPIGRPIANTEAYVLDAELQPVPIGVPGELYLGGDGLAQGYLNRPELTAKKFVRHPFAKSPEARLYRTGDVVRFRADGNLEFLGRADRQIKLRGFRIELDEIESTLASCAGVRDCVVSVNSDEVGEKRVAAYVVVNGASEPTSDDLRRYLRTKLPDYMVPAAFVFLPSLPLNANGKINRAALPKPDFSRVATDAQFLAPRDEVEIRLAVIWQELLGVERVGATDHFFDLGGHSLLAVRLLARVEREFGRALPITTLFQNPTLEHFAKALRGARTDEPHEATALVPIQSRGNRPPLFLVHGAGGGMFWGYTNLARHLGDDQPVYAFRSRALDGLPELRSIEALADAYLASLRAFQPHGPYCLGGYCFGGNVAYEMARKLRAVGEEVAVLALMNALPPDSKYKRVKFSWRWFRRFAANVMYLLRWHCGRSHQQRRDFIKWQWHASVARLRRRFSRKNHQRISAADFVDLSACTPEERPAWDAHVEALFQHRTDNYDGPVWLFRSCGHQFWCSFDPAYGWREFARGELTICPVAGAHEQILEEPFVASLANELKRALASVAVVTVKSSDEKNGRVVAGALECSILPKAEWNRTQRDFPVEQSYAQAFEAQVARTPEAIAVRFEGKELSYAELNRRANQIAHFLRTQGIGPEVLVAVNLERSVELMVALLGVFKAGGAYLPLDSKYPRERLRYMLSDSRASLLLTQLKFQDDFAGSAAKVICLDDPKLQKTIGAESETNPPSCAVGENLAYVIYTSGSTGTPKGVEILHRSLLNHNFAVCERYELSRTDRVLQFSPFSFDISVEEIFPTWLAGGAVVLRTEDALSSPAHFFRFVRAERLTVLNLPTAYWHELMNALPEQKFPECVRAVIIGGERASEAGFRRWKEHVGARVKLINTYGPTEATVIATTYVATETDDGALPIGAPIANTQVFILDADLKPVAVGESGELYIGGTGLARGYLNRPELTAEKFIRNPIASSDSSERLYRTGDLARWRTDGNIEFVGREDQQVKIRGFRVELPEVEAALHEYARVQDAVVMAREDTPGRKQLVAYVVWREPGAVTDLREFLKAKLPAHMIPTNIVVLERLPLSPSGKVDRRSLPAPGNARPELESPYIAPRSDTEVALTEIWQDVLELEAVGVDDSFFNLGGHSLLAAQVISRIRTQFHAEVPLSGLFRHPTIAALAKELDAGRWQSENAKELPLKRVSRDGDLPASFVQERLWVLEQLEPGGHAYNVSVALRLHGELNRTAFERAAQEVFARHEAFRTVFAMEQGRLIQVIQPKPTFSLRYVDLSEQPEAARFAAGRELICAEARQPFDLTRGPLTQALLVRLSDEEHLFCLVMHHAISDGWSQAIFFRELQSLYEAFATDATPAALPPLPIQIVDHAAWQREVMSGELLNRELRWWRETLADAPPAIALPADAIDSVPEHAAARAVKQISGELNRFCQKNGVTPFMVSLTALAVTLQIWTLQIDLVLGTVVAGRNRRELENVIGCFMNFLPLRVKVVAQQTVREILFQVRDVVLAAQAHQDCPFEKIVETINPRREKDRNPLYNVGLLLQNFPTQPFTSAKLKSEVLPVEAEAALLDLRFEVEETASGWSWCCEYKTKLFRVDTISQLLVSMDQVLVKLMREPDARVSDFTIAPELGTRRDQSQAVEPEVIAVTATFTAEFLAEPLQHWMKELELPATIRFAPYNQVFQQLLDPESLQSRNARGLNLVLIRLEDWEAIPDQNGSAKAGMQQTAREFVAALQTAAQRTMTPWLICLCPSAKTIAQQSERAEEFLQLENELAETFRPLNGVQLVTTAELFEYYPVQDHYDAQGDELGHVPYTPAFFTAVATMVARRYHALKRPPCKVIALDCDHTLWAGICGEDGPNGIEIDPPRRALQEFMRRQLDAGRLLCLCSKNNEADVTAVFERAKNMPLQPEHFVTRQINWNPKSANLRALAEELHLGLDSFVLVDDNPMECAEVAANCPDVVALQLPEDPQLIPQFLKHCWIFDTPKTTQEDAKRTEFYRQNREREALRQESVSFANFLQALRLKIEIAKMAMADVARVAQLTQRTNQFNTTTQRRNETELLQLAQTGAEIFTVRVSDRFGDYGLVGVMICQPEAAALVVENLLLSCRVLGKGVEHRMLAHVGNVAHESGLAEARVRFSSSAKNQPAQDFLERVAGQYRQAHNGGWVYVIPAMVAKRIEFSPAKGDGTVAPTNRTANESATIASVKRFDRWRWIALEANEPKRILEMIEAKNPTRKSASVKGEPTSELEWQLCAVWQEVLRVERVGIHDDFFELGGHSFLAVRLFAQIERVTGKQLPVLTIFQAPTVAQLAQRMQKTQSAKSASSLIVPIQPRGTRPPLFLAHGAGGDVMWGYANLAKHLSHQQPVFGLQARPTDAPDKFGTLEEMAANYVAELRRFHPHGPYCLGGYCFGGDLAYEMARQLQAQGEEVALVALIESTPEGGTYEKVRWWRLDFPFRFSRNVYFWWRDFYGYPAEERRSLVRRKIQSLGRKLRTRLGRRQKMPSAVDLDDIIDTAKFPEHEIRLWQAHLQLLMRHTSQPYSGRVTVFRTAAHPLFSSYEHDLGWGPLAAGGVTVKVIAGSHGNIFLEPHVQDLAQQLAATLDNLAAAENSPKKGKP